MESSLKGGWDKFLFFHPKFIIYESQSPAPYYLSILPFFLSIHPTVVDNPEGVKFLHEFFKIVREDLG
ncbi:hypothetical protein PFDSM3638_10090 [Pyrococcus furiosus DSM 3638]|uniref:Uncharacterized protein n=2 Tax=Pyrococcus furiosus TaxID=2261 RepID=A0A5C0XUN0_PYRFU|nr:hypothetical protein PFC_08560 [Pyrococcus furiosus COM1]QEK79594.1 hypothetical protein PFDSM3638_10090 [Pyrococcus furiosus DSM 3638]